MKYIKPPLSFPDQADLLLGRGMIGDRDLIISRLQVVSYYRLTGYWYPFRQPNDAFAAGTTFEAVWERYVFDRRLRMVVLDAIERFEVAIRTQLSFHHSHAYGAFGYAMDPASLPKLKGKFYAEYIDRLRDETKHCKEKFVKHFNDTYGDNHEFLPIWMATETMSFGTMLTVYNSCSNAVKQSIASTFNLPAKVLGSWLLTINAARNTCAHHSRLWNKEFGVRASMPKQKDYPMW